MAQKPVPNHIIHRLVALPSRRLSSNATSLLNSLPKLSSSNATSLLNSLNDKIKAAKDGLLPAVSKDNYKKRYGEFMKWYKSDINWL